MGSVTVKEGEDGRPYLSPRQPDDMRGVNPDVVESMRRCMQSPPILVTDSTQNEQNDEQINERELPQVLNIGNISMDEILSINDKFESNVRDAEILNHKRVLSAICIQK